MKFNRPFPDHNQNFWELASIQTASFGVPVIILGGQLAKQYGATATIGSICVGNLLIWLLGLVIISMTYKDRTNAIQNVKRYLGRKGAFLAAFCLMFAFMSWYIMQLRTSTMAINNIFKIGEDGIETLTLRAGAAMGLFAALIAIGGIRLIKWLNVICLPILLIYYCYAFFLSDHSVQFKNWGLSLSAVTTVILFQLPGTINLPTFFRHSRSLAHSFLALTLMAILLSVLEIFSIWVGFEGSLDVAFSKFSYSNGFFQLILAISFIVLLTTCTEIVNIYFASASWEAITTKVPNSKEYAIIGLVGTAAYTFLQITYPIQFLWDLSNYFLSSLGIVLLINFIVQVVIKRRPKTIGKLIGNASWISGCVTSIILEIKGQDSLNILLSSMGISALFFLLAILIEETIWAIKKLLNNNVK